MAAGTVVGWCVGGLVPLVVGVGGLVLGCVVDAGAGARGRAGAALVIVVVRVRFVSAY